ncbi:hypothetical protein ACJW31_04G012300 [Castanea mollissima]
MIRGGEKGLATTKTPGVDYRGILACLDGYMNIAMEQIEEYVNGQLKNKYDNAFIRGNNGFLACLDGYMNIAMEQTE